jgi:hypothetical protein
VPEPKRAFSSTTRSRRYITSLNYSALVYVYDDQFYLPKSMDSAKSCRGGPENRIDFRLPVSPLRKIPGAWAERAGVLPPACREGRGFLLLTSRQISQSKVMQEPAIKRATQQGLL